jgi:hypothetical protein
MHFLFTDPATSPRSELGRIMFGALYGLGVVGLFYALGRSGLPAFYDKLLPVPLLNVAIQGIDRVARSKLLRWFDPSNLGRSLAGRQRNLAYITVWAILFALMSAVSDREVCGLCMRAQGVGDDHPGQWLPFSQQACQKNQSYALRYLANEEASYCADESGWSCDEFGIVQAERERDRSGALALERGGALGLSACVELVHFYTDPRARTRAGHCPVYLGSNPNLRTPFR